MAIPEAVRISGLVMTAFDYSRLFSLQLVNAPALETYCQIGANARATEVGRRPLGIPGVGPVLASALVALVPDPGAFRSGRHLAAWIGPVPRQNSSGSKERGVKGAQKIG